MSGFFSRMNPTLRGFLIIAAVALAIVVLRLQITLVALLVVGEIAQWPRRAQVVFYGAALLAVADLAVNWWGGAHGVQVLAFVAVLALCGFAMFRTWRDQHTYS